MRFVYDLVGPGKLKLTTNFVSMYPPTGPNAAKSTVLMADATALRFDYGP